MMTEDEARKKCSVNGCARPSGQHAARGMCVAHYSRHRRGVPLDGPFQERGTGWVSSHGYRYIGERGEHRMIMERIIQRRLSYNEIVHHKDGNTQNNDPSNLEIMMRGNHIRLHTKGKTNEQRKREKALYGQCLAGKP